MPAMVIVLALMFSGALPGVMRAQQPPAADSAKGMMMLTVFLRHDESKTLDQINQHRQETGFSAIFRPAEWKWFPGM
jgi:hypothetical protein